MNAHLPVTHVTVMEDRAQVTREGAVTLTGGIARLELADMSSVAVDRSLKVEVQGATFVDAKIVRRWKERPAGLPADASAAEQKHHHLELTAAEQVDTLGRLHARREVLSAARKDVLRGIAEGAGSGQAMTETWHEQLRAISEAERALDVSLGDASRAHQATQQELNELRRAISLSHQPIRTFECVLHLTLDGQGQATVRLSYLVPCAVWRPSYRASLKEGPTPTVLFEAEAMVWQHTGELWKDVALQFSTARPTLGLNAATLTEDRLRTRAKTQVEKKTVEVEFREEAIQSAGETSGGGGDMPGVDDGGETRLMKALHPSTIVSDGQPYRVPLFSFETPVKVERVCPAALTSLVSTVARGSNAAREVILAGPVDLIRSSGFVGRSTVKFTAPGETFALSFGADDALRVVRTVEEKHEETLLTGKKKTRTQVTLSISNSGRSAGQLFIEERIPVSEVKEVEVNVLSKECKPAPLAISKDGIARFEANLGPNATQKLTFVWELVASSKVTQA